MNVEIIAPAEAELDDACRYYEAQESGLGTRFRDQFRSTLQRIVALPHAWRPVPGGLRNCPLHHFPYGVVYAVEEARIVIVAVAHHHRRPDYWADRY